MEVCLKNREVLYSLCCTVGKSLCDSDTGKGLREYAGNVCKEANDDKNDSYDNYYHSARNNCLVRLFSGLGGLCHFACPPYIFIIKN